MKNNTILILIMISFYSAKAKLVKGFIKTTEQWIFIERFCFLSNNGKIDFELNFPEIYSPISLILYFDDQWSLVYKKDMTCDEKILYINSANNQILTMSSDSSSYYLGCRLFEGIVTCKATRNFVSARERWWYLALSHCTNSSGLALLVNYSIHMTNGDTFFTKEFSADEFDILEVDIAFLFGFIILFILSIILANILKKKVLFHTSFKLYIVSLVFIIFSYFFLSVAYAAYANTGIEESSILISGTVLRAASILVFISMLLMMAKGYTITRGKISSNGMIKLVLFISVYALTYAILFFYDAFFNDPGDNLYIYESPPGYGILILRVLAWIYFTYACIITVKQFSSKKNFYYSFYIFYTFWFLFEPLFVLIVSYACPKYMRAKIVNGIDTAVTFLAFAYFMFLTRPSHSNANFPYHVKTSQIGITSSLNAAINYAPTSDNIVTSDSQQGPDFTQLFNVTKRNSSNPPIPRDSGNMLNGLPINPSSQNRNKLPPINGKAEHPDKY